MKPLPLFFLITGAALCIYGVSLLFRPPQPGTAPQAIQGSRPPTDFGLPAYPGSGPFISSEAGPEAGSVSFQLKKGTAAEVASFYRKGLLARGLKFVRERPMTVRPGFPENPAAPAIHGRRLEWDDPARSRQVSLTAFDFPQKSSRVQAVLSWRSLE